MVPDKNIAADVDNDMTIADLKKLFLEKLAEEKPGSEEGLALPRLRFFCLGKELKDELFLYSYDLVDDLTIQCVQRPQMS